MTTTALSARRPQVAGTGWPKLLARTLGAEWVKLRSVRSTYGSLAAAVVVTVATAALAAWAITTDDQPNPAPATQLAAVGASVGQFGLVALVALAITGERYSPEVAALLLGAWAVGALAAGVIALHRRDP